MPTYTHGSARNTAWHGPADEIKRAKHISYVILIIRPSSSPCRILILNLPSRIRIAVWHHQIQIIVARMHYIVPSCLSLKLKREKQFHSLCVSFKSNRMRFKWTFGVLRMIGSVGVDYELFFVYVHTLVSIQKTLSARVRSRWNSSVLFGPASNKFTKSTECIRSNYINK